MESGSEDEEEQKQPAQPYMSLMRSLVESAPHKAKRRKLDHAPDDDKVASKPEPTVEPAKDEEGEEEERDVDLVEEPEEDPADAPPEDLFDEDDNLDSSDPFEVHFADPKEDEFQPRLKAVQAGKWRTERAAAKSTRIFLSVPDVGDAELKSLPAPVSTLSDLKLKKRLHEALAPKHAKFDEVEQTIAPMLFNYQDLLYCNRTVSGSQSVRRMVCLHALNHIFKTRDRVIKNNARIARTEGNEDLELRDQGFTRPKVLMILPTRQSCVKMVDMIVSICEPDQQENRKRFADGYIDKQSKFSDDKPEDFRDLFSGNDDDMFRLGMKFTRKTIKYFAQFYNSDIIFASPLGLRMAIGSEEEKKVDFDFLSSIELVIVDQADALLMQNWEHVEFIFEHLNIQPKDAHGCDFSRVRSWYLDDQAKYFRQTAIFSAFNTPELAELVRAHCHNWAGKARLQQECPGVIQHLGVKARQTFSRFEAASIAADPDARFAYFTKAILPVLAKHKARDAGGTLVFVPSYLDFVRVRNYFANNPAAAHISFGAISEYTDVPEAMRARSHFLTGRHKVLLYTERAHHFRRYQIRGVRRVVMYGLPDNPLFYREIAGGCLQKSEQALLLEPGQGAVRAMFSKYDVMKLERVVGTARVGKMIHEQGDTFDFV
ncbi:0bbf0f71-b6b2-479c-a7ba-6775edc5c4ea [Thermothielavioides terrestris]|uniref:U3 small nucleolar RNA-associated protein 25 n=1 Tax=Thermothielavioides terrestris TaxID=2587410 RepID=A0A3S4ANI9_9PEZI|nr:0bbf0f71-b6b2-479c-a7ba-6775edc5c4ea [Thermothielavioides terrestris]